MKNKLLTVVLSIALVISCAFGLAACSQEKQIYTVTYDAAGGAVSGEATYEYSAEEGTFLEQPETPVRSGYKFAGWAKDESGSQLWVFAVDKLSSDMKLYAVWSQIYTVTLDAVGGAFLNGSRTQTVSAAENTSISVTESPTREGYVLCGWTTDTRGQRVWDFKLDKVTADITLYAVWAKEQTITFNANGGTFSEPSANALSVSDEAENEDETRTVTVARGFKIEEPETPYLNGYLFKGWFTQKEDGLKWDFYNDTVTNDLTLYARWEEIVDDYEVTYELNYDGAEAVVMQTENGYAVYEPAERKGFIFNGWWYGTKSGDKVSLTTKYDETARITEDTTLYADWIDESKIISVLSAPSVKRSGSTFSWNAVEGCAGYIVRVTTGSYTSSIVKTYSTSYTSWTFPSDRVYESGVTYYVSVRAKGNGTNTVSSGYSSGNTYSYRVLASTAIAYDWTTNVLTWTEVPNASGYELSVNNSVIRTSTSTSYDMSGYEAGSYSVKVVAKGGNIYVDSTTSVSITKYKLLKPEVSAAVKVSDKTYRLMWDEVKNADGYRIIVGGKSYTSQTNSYSITDFSPWGDGIEAAVKVYAFNSDGDYINSESCEITLKKLVKITLTNNVTNAEHEDIKNTGRTFNKELTFDLSFDLNGGSGSISKQTVSASNPMTYPAVPTRSGYVFRGWYKNSACTDLFDFSKNLTSDTTVYAGWAAMATDGAYCTLMDISTTNLSGVTVRSGASYKSYMYFAALGSGSLNIFYKLNYAYSCTLTIENLTTNTSIRSASFSSTTYGKSAATVNAGDVIKITVSGSNNNVLSCYVSSSTGSSTAFKNQPETGGAAEDLMLLGMNFSHAKTQVLEAGSSISLSAPETLNGKKFVGWYLGDKCISTSVKITVHEMYNDGNYVAKYE